MADQINAGYRLPYWLLALYAVLLLALGWFGAKTWDGDPDITPACAALPPIATVPMPAVSTVVSPAQASSPPVVAAACVDNRLPPLRYSAHVYAENSAQRSITLNSRQYREGDSLDCGFVVTQIQQDVTILEKGGQMLVLDALEDWPGGAPNEENVEEEAQP